MSVPVMRDAFICDFVRTPIGRYGGALSSVRTDDLAAHPIRTLKERHSGVDWDRLDEVILGCANQAGEDNRNVARMATLLAGLPVSVPGTTLNRLCGSGLDAVGTAARAIKAGEAELVVAGGVESMSRAPFVMGKATEAFQRQADIYDTTIGWRFVNPVMKAQYGIDSMPETGENVAEEFQVSRRDQDAFALRSQQRAAKAQGSGFFAREIAPVSIRTRKGETVVERDEHPRPDTTLDMLERLKTPFRDPGTVTAGNASGVNDGAAALIIASEEAARRHGLTPRARIVAMATAGVPPRIMGIGPVPATQKLMERTGRTLSEVDIVELNEAFASQGIAVLRQLGLPEDGDHVNPHGGAIALGHPLGMSGARLALTSVNALETLGLKSAVATMCIGVGQGIAMLIERV
jgi:3-oxoadipyl-CoA thiolase